MVGFEPTTPRFQSEYADLTALHPVNVHYVLRWRTVPSSYLTELEAYNHTAHDRLVPFYRLVYLCRKCGNRTHLIPSPLTRWPSLSPTSVGSTEFNIPPWNCQLVPIGTLFLIDMVHEIHPSEEISVRASVIGLIRSLFTQGR